MDFVERVWRFFCSLRLTLVVLILLAFGCVVGMFCDQTLSFEEHASHFVDSPRLFRLFWYFELGDVFHSWWFSVVVLLLALNLIACSIERLPKIWIDIQNPPLCLTDSLFKKMTLKARFNIDNYDEAVAVIKRLYPKKQIYTRSSDEMFIYSEKHKYGRTGVYVVHIALLMIMFGSMAATNFGVDGMMVIEKGGGSHEIRAKGPGGTSHLQNLAFDVVCRDFRLKTYVDGSPMAFESDIEIYDPMAKINPVVQKTIRVNEPLQYRGYTFYQASYQQIEGEESVRVLIGPHGKTVRVFESKIGSRIFVSPNTTIVPLEHVEDYAGLGSALKVVQITKGREPTQFYVFRQYPDFDRMVRRGEYDIIFQGSQKAFATGVSVGKVPGLAVVFLGFILLFVGMYMAFCMSHRRYFACIKSAAEGQSELRIAGFAHRHLASFKDEFEQLKTQISHHFGEPIN